MNNEENLKPGTIFQRLNINKPAACLYLCGCSQKLTMQTYQLLRKKFNADMHMLKNKKKFVFFSACMGNKNTFWKRAHVILLAKYTVSNTTSSYGTVSVKVLCFTGQRLSGYSEHGKSVTQQLGHIYFYVLISRS